MHDGNIGQETLCTLLREYVHIVYIYIYTVYIYIYCIYIFIYLSIMFENIHSSCNFVGNFRLWVTRMAESTLGQWIRLDSQRHTGEPGVLPSNCRNVFVENIVVYQTKDDKPYLICLLFIKTKIKYKINCWYIIS